MKQVLFLFFISFVCSTIINKYIDEEGKQIEHHVGKYLTQDAQGNYYRVQYNVQLLGENHIVNLDTIKGINDVECDISNIEMEIDFLTEQAANSFFNIINKQLNDRYITGTKWNCSEAQKKSTMLMRKVLSARKSGISVILQTAQGYYEETIKEGEIKLESLPNVTEAEKTFCFGVNTQNCEAAAGPINLYENKYISLQCSNCFIGAKATVFLEVVISWFKLKRVAAGFKDIGVKGGFVMDMKADGGWSAGMDKTYKIVDQAIILQFWIGPIPISIWYDIPLHLVATAMIQAKASATAGAVANWNFGNAYVSWDDKNGWTVAKPNPVFNWQHQLKGDLKFNGEGMLNIVPQFIIHATRILYAGIKIDPALMLKAYGDLEKKELCADLSYKALAEVNAGIEINIPILKIKWEKNFGPYKILDTGEKSIGHWCVKANEGEEKMIEQK